MSNCSVTQHGSVIRLHKHRVHQLCCLCAQRTAACSTLSYSVLQSSAQSLLPPECVTMSTFQVLWVANALATSFNVVSFESPVHRALPTALITVQSLCKASSSSANVPARSAFDTDCSAAVNGLSVHALQVHAQLYQPDQHYLHCCPVWFVNGPLGMCYCKCLISCADIKHTIYVCEQFVHMCIR